MKQVCAIVAFVLTAATSNVTFATYEKLQ